MTDKKKTLRSEDIVTDRKVGRRGALGVLGASVLGVAAATAVGGAANRAEAKANDSDPNDAAGHGRTGFTDRDSGGSSDGAGRGVCAERGHSDSDNGAGSDPAGRGRGPCH